MINTIALKNFQSHEDNILHLSPGINVIVGSSDSGKTAILRGIKWLLRNRPSGLSYVSYWNRDKNGKPKEPSVVTMVTGDRNWRVHRVRTGDFNGYETESIKLEDEEGIEAPYNTFEAVGTDAPKEITDMFNLSEINFQEQMDSPFLLSESSAEVARFFNKIIHLDIIDKVLSNAESIRRKINSDIRNTEEEISRLEKDIKTLEWIDDAESEMKKAERWEERIRNKKEDVTYLSGIIDGLSGANKAVKFYSFIDDAEKLINQTVNIRDDINDIKGEIRRCLVLMNDYETSTKEIITANKLTIAESIVKDTLVLNMALEVKRDTISSLENIIKDHAWKEQVIKDSIKLMNELESQLPTICPTCGQEWRRNNGQNVLCR